MEVGYFDQLPAEVILKIFNYLNYIDLCRLRRTCKRFEQIITSWDHILLKEIVPIVTNQKYTQFISRYFL